MKAGQRASCCLARSTWSCMSCSFQKPGFLEITDSEPVLSGYWNGINCCCCCCLCAHVCVCLRCVCLCMHAHMCMCDKAGERVGKKRKKHRARPAVCVCAFPASFVVWPDKCGLAQNRLFNLAAILLFGAVSGSSLCLPLSWQSYV